MSYTNATLVRNHIEFVQPILKQITDQPLIFSNTEFITFFNGQIINGSVVVKSIRDFKQRITSLTVTSGEQVVSPVPIVNGTLLCSSNKSLSKIYIENIDYVLNYNTGKVNFPDTGSLSPNDAVTFFYLPFYVYQENSDYKIIHESGKISLTSSTEIKFGEQVYIDYQPTSPAYSENIINNAVIEANAIIESSVDPSRQFGANLVLQTAATYRALEILCRSSAAKELASQTGRESSAKAWISLGDVYLTRCNELIRSFKEPVSQISNPTHS